MSSGWVKCGGNQAEPHRPQWFERNSLSSAKPNRKGVQDAQKWLAHRTLKSISVFSEYEGQGSHIIWINEVSVNEWKLWVLRKGTVAKTRTGTRWQGNTKSCALHMWNTRDLHIFVTYECARFCFAVVVVVIVWAPKKLISLIKKAERKTNPHTWSRWMRCVVWWCWASRSSWQQRRLLVLLKVIEYCTCR